MKVEKITVYINYRNEKHIFILKDYILNLITSTSEKLAEYWVTLVFEPITKRKSNGFLSDLILDGIIMDCKRINICIQDNPSYKNGVFSCKVKWFYIYNQNVDDIKIKGINFVSPEINYIYSKKRYIKDDFDLNDGAFNNYSLEIQGLNRQLLVDLEVDDKEIINKINWLFNIWAFMQ